MHKNVFTKNITKCEFICTVPNKELVCDFPFLSKSLEIKKHLLNSMERTLLYCKSKIVFKSPAKIVNQFRFNDVLPIKLCSFVYSFKCNSCYLIWQKKIPLSCQGSQTYGNFTFDKQIR